MPANHGAIPRGWVYYDAACPFCVRQQRRWGPLFARRGFVWLPLQTPGTAARLRVSEVELHRELKLLGADGCVVGGAAAWAVLCRSVPWLKPVGFLLGWPGVRRLAALGYAWVARRRYRFGRGCGMGRTASRRHAAFFELP